MARDRLGVDSDWGRRVTPTGMQAASDELDGHERRDTSSCVYLNNRYHDPTLGSFLSVDPLVQETGDPYIYGAANPTTYSDPDGERPTTAPLVDAGGCWNLDKCWSYWYQNQPAAGREHSPRSTDVDLVIDAADELEEMVDDARGGLDQLIDPLTCGLKGIDPVGKTMGNCTPEQVERQEQYQDAGEAVCDASRTPVVGSVIPEVSWSGLLAALADQAVGETLTRLGEAGSQVARSASRATNRVANAATAIDLACRVSP